MRELCEVVELKAIALLVLGTGVHIVAHQENNLGMKQEMVLLCTHIYGNEIGNGNGIVNTESYNICTYSTYVYPLMYKMYSETFCLC